MAFRTIDELRNTLYELCKDHRLTNAEVVEYANQIKDQNNANDPATSPEDIARETFNYFKDAIASKLVSDKNKTNMNNINKVLTLVMGCAPSVFDQKKIGVSTTTASWDFSSYLKNEPKMEAPKLVAGTPAKLSPAAELLLKSATNDAEVMPDGQAKPVARLEKAEVGGIIAASTKWISDATTVEECKTRLQSELKLIEAANRIPMDQDAKSVHSTWQYEVTQAADARIKNLSDISRFLDTKCPTIKVMNELDQPISFDLCGFDYSNCNSSWRFGLLAKSGSRGTAEAHFSLRDIAQAKFGYMQLLHHGDPRWTDPRGRIEIVLPDYDDSKYHPLAKRIFAQLVLGNECGTLKEAFDAFKKDPSTTAAERNLIDLAARELGL